MGKVENVSRYEGCIVEFVDTVSLTIQVKAFERKWTL
jgi:hypothetical protein